MRFLLPSYSNMGLHSTSPPLSVFLICWLLKLKLLLKLPEEVIVTHLCVGAFGIFIAFRTICHIKENRILLQVVLLFTWTKKYTF